MKSFKFIILLLFLSINSFGQDIDNSWYQKSNKVQETIMSKCSSGSHSQKNRNFCYGEWKNLEGTNGIQFKVKGPMISSDQLDGNRQTPPKGVVFYEAHIVFRNIGNQFISFKFSPKRCDYLKLHNDDYYGFWVGLLPGGYSQEIDVDLECTNTTLEYVVSEIIHCDQIKYKNTDKESVTYYVKKTCYDPTENMNIKNQVIRKNGKQFQENETVIKNKIKNQDRISSKTLNKDELLIRLSNLICEKATFSNEKTYSSYYPQIITQNCTKSNFINNILYLEVSVNDRKDKWENWSYNISYKIPLDYFFDENTKYKKQIFDDKHFAGYALLMFNTNTGKVVTTSGNKWYSGWHKNKDGTESIRGELENNINLMYDENFNQEYEEIIQKLKTGDFQATNSVSKESSINKQEKSNFVEKQSKKDNSNKNENYSYENAKKISEEYNNYISQYNNDKDAIKLELNLKKLLFEHPDIFTTLDKQFYIFYSSVLTSNASKLYDEGKFNDAEKKIRESLKYDSDNVTTNQYLFNILIFKYNDKKIKNVKDIIKELNILIDKLSLIDKENISQYLEIKNKINK